MRPPSTATPAAKPNAPRRAAGRPRWDALGKLANTVFLASDRGHHHPGPTCKPRRKGFTGGGTLLPMHDQPRSPGKRRYLRRFDHGTPLALYHQTPSLPGPADRAVRQRPRLHQPGCDAPASHSQAYFTSPPGPALDAPTSPELTPGLTPTTLLTAGKGWTTHKHPRPPPNGYHHPSLDHGQPHQHLPPPPNDSSTTKTTTTNPIDQQSKPHATTPHNYKHRVRQGLAGANTPRW